MSDSRDETPPSSGGLWRGLQAALRLCQFDAEALARFDASVAGFWRSYQAGLLCLPLHLGVVKLITADAKEGFPFANYALIFFIQWLAWPLAAERLAARFGCSRGFLRYAVAYNWLNAPQITLFSAVVLVALTSGAQAMAAQLMVSVCFIYVLVTKGWLARRALDCTSGQAAGLVAADVGVNLLIAMVAELIRALAASLSGF